MFKSGSIINYINYLYAGIKIYDNMLYIFYFF